MLKKSHLHKLLFALFMIICREAQNLPILFTARFGKRTTISEIFGDTTSYFDTPAIHS